jgi:hypothetical protein
MGECMWKQKKYVIVFRQYLGRMLDLISVQRLAVLGICVLFLSVRYSHLRHFGYKTGTLTVTPVVL